MPQLAVQMEENQIYASREEGWFFNLTNFIINLHGHYSKVVSEIYYSV